MINRHRRASAFLLVSLVAFACGGDDGGRGATTAPATPGGTSATSTAVTAAVPSTATTATSTTATPATASTAVPTTVGPPPSTIWGGLVQFTVRVGEPIVFETARPANFHAGSSGVWLVPEGAASRTAELVPAGLLAVGRARGDALVVDGVVPRTLGTAVNNGAATFRAVTPGRYRVEAAGAQVAWLLVEGTGDDALPAGGPPAVRAERALLADDGLAGIAFGTAEDDAHRRLVERFGQPTSDTGWVDVCIAHRTVTWGGLMVRFGWTDRSGPRAAGERVLAAYSYVASDDGPQGLTSTDGIALGAALDHVLAARGPWSITTEGYDPALVLAWRGARPDEVAGPFAVRVDRDVTAAGPRPVVVAIASAWPTTMQHPFASC
jgi:hypothetical protein